MKRFLSLILVFALLLACAPVIPLQANADTVTSGTCGDNLTWKLETSGVLTISGTGKMTSFSSSSSSPWYDYRSVIKSVIIESGVTSIDSYAFSFCRRLTSVVIPDSVTSIGDWAFYYCASLTSIVIPDSVTSIGDGAFRDCSILTGICVDANNPNYSSDEYGVLFDKDKTTLIQAPGAISGRYTIPDSVTSIGSSAFENCSSLTSVVIPDSVTSIGSNTFSYCSSLTSVFIPACVTNVGEYAFSSCSGLTKVFYGGTKEQKNEISIGIKNDNLKNATWVYNVTEEGFADKDFGMVSLTIQSLPEKKNYKIGEALDITGLSVIGVFSDGSIADIDNGYTVSGFDSAMSGMQTVVVTYGGISATFDVFVASKSGVTGALTWLMDEQGTLVISGKGAMADYNYYDAPWRGEDVQKVIIEDGVTKIGDGAFFNGANIVSVEIGNTVTTIGGDAFYGCTSLTNITLPDSLTTLKDAAFFYSGLTSIVIPDSVTTMGKSIFTNCSELENVVIGSGVTKLDYYTFQSCEKLTTVTLPTSVTQIWGDAFTYCQSLTTVYYPGTRAQAAQISIDSSNYKLIGADWIYNEEAKEETVIYSGTCGANVTWELGDLGTLTISGTGATNNCNYPSQVPWYSYRKDIRRVIVEDGVTTLPRYAFNECYHLSDVKLSKSLTVLDIYAFNYCYCLRSIVIPEGVTLIDNYAFYCCESLTEVTLPDSVTNIGSDAFWLCDLAAVYYGGTEEQKANIIIGSYNGSLLDATWYYDATPCYYIATNGEKTIYTSLEDALKQADGGTIQLMVNTTVDTVALKPGVTLDLNGYTLTADLFVAMNGAVVTDGEDCTGGGVLKIAKDNLALAKDNGGVVPIWNGVDGYVFTKVTFQQMAVKAGAGAAQYIFLPTFSNAEAAALMADGGTDNGLKFKVGLTWSDGQCQQFYTYSDDLVKQVFDGTGQWVFSLSITGISGITDMVANAIVVTDSGTQATNVDTAIKAG